MKIHPNRTGCLLALLLLTSSCARTADDTVAYFTDANTRDTYATVHRFAEARHLATGKGVKVGIIDKYFGFKKQPDLYAGGADFLDDTSRFENSLEHGFWMATTLKELAPDAQIYALNARSTDRAGEAAAIERAVDWAILHKLDVLTYSAEAIAPKYRPVVDRALERAAAAGIVTVFINTDHPANILPYTAFNPAGEKYRRAPDLKVYHFDYNVLRLEAYRKYVESNRTARSGDAIPYLSLSSTSIVVAAGVAMMKEVNPALTPPEVRVLLTGTTRRYKISGREVDGVLDCYAAVTAARKGRN